MRRTWAAKCITETLNSCQTVHTVIGRYCCRHILFSHARSCYLCAISMWQAETERPEARQAKGSMTSVRSHHFTCVMVCAVFMWQTETQRPGARQAKGRMTIIRFHHFTFVMVCAAAAWQAERTGGGERYSEGMILNGMTQPAVLSHESFCRGQREEVKQFDEVVETFRQHAYSLRRLILNGSNQQSVDMLRMYFQVSC